MLGPVQDLLHEHVFVIFDKREILCILMQYEMELKYTFGTILAHHEKISV